MSLPNPNTVVTESRLKEFYNGILPYLGGSADAGFTPVGTIISVMGVTAPANYLACDGTVYNIADYPELANYFYQQFGSKNKFGGNGTTTFAVPDLKGEFLRGAGTNSHEYSGNGAEVGEHQRATFIPNIFTDKGTAFAGIGLSDSQMIIGNPDYAVTAPSSNRMSINTTSGTSSDKRTQLGVRPTNTSVLFCIATKNIYLNPSLDYSTDEKVVGTWIDGKTLYQRTIVVTGITDFDTSATKYVNLLEASNLNLVYSDGQISFTYSNRSYTRSINNTFYNDAHTSITMATDVYKDSQNNYIRLRIAQTMTSSLSADVQVTVRYTKIA